MGRKIAAKPRLAGNQSKYTFVYSEAKFTSLYFACQTDYDRAAQTEQGKAMAERDFELHAELTIRVGEATLANPKRAELLRQIDKLGNLTQAAKLAGYSYKGAWDAIDQMAALSGGTLIERHAGGKGGGGTTLTERGRQLLRNFTLIQDEHQRFIARLNTLAQGLSNDYALANEIAMKTSARNQFAGIIRSIVAGPVNDELGILVNGSQLVTASITHGSCRELQLDIGAKVFALIKASSVSIALPSQAASAKNAFAGIVQTVIRGERTSEVTVLLDSGLALVGTLPNQRIDTLGLKQGDAVVAGFDPSSVIIGIAA